MSIPYADIETKWKKLWEEKGIYRVSHKSDKPKYYVLDMFPYPSGSGLHVGHPLGYISSDIISRYKTMTGFNVLHPMGYDAFGLPAEQYAIQTGIHPSIATEQNIGRYRAQLSNLGFNYDWSREVKTCDPRFYHWTQWIFLQLFGHYYDEAAQSARPIEDLVVHFEKQGTQDLRAAHSGKEEFTAEEWKAMSPAEKDTILMNYRLAYRKVSYVNWCEELGTVLANDEVKDGLSERGGFPVERKAMLQWSLRITAYADRLLQGLDELDWTDSMKTIQRNWIGKSPGAQVFFDINDHQDKIEIFTTRPDTIFGATFMVLAPEHPLVDKITTPGQQQEIGDYLKYVKTRSERDRISEVKEVSGAFTGAYAINPINNEAIPIWIAEYVLMDYGTGAIMAVPADDTRDRAFAGKYGLPIVEIIDRSDFPDAGMEDKVGVLQNSGFLNGMTIPNAIDAILSKLENLRIGKAMVQFKMRDAIYSRQRYWGEPIPILFDENGVAKAMDADALPLVLPDLEDFKPGGTKAPLGRLDNWVNAGNGLRRETDTMPGYAGSSWYFLRYMDPHNDKAFASGDALNYWKDVDLYIGGTEHAVGHLMYARFWHKFLHDKGLVPTGEPFRKLINQGMIQGVIEYLHLQKEKDGDTPVFRSAELVSPEDEDNFILITTHIDYVKDPGTPHSHLDAKGILDFVKMRPEYENASFETKKGDFTPEQLRKSGPVKASFLTRSEIGKMSKRLHNVVNPDDVVAEYGADCFRMYEMFLGPIEQSKPWDTQGIDGVSKFLRRLWQCFYDEKGNWIVKDQEPGMEELKALHQCIDKVRSDIERYSFNTCVSSFMICLNTLRKLESNNKQILEQLLLLLAPFAPFLTEELWERLGNSFSIHQQDYPTAEVEYLKEDTINYPVAVNGKKRTEMTFDANADKSTIEKAILGSSQIQKWTDGKQIRKVIVVPGRMINIVVAP